MALVWSPDTLNAMGSLFERCAELVGVSRPSAGTAQGVTPAVLGDAALLAAARKLAGVFHADQRDAVGAPYNGHLCRVAERAERNRVVFAAELDRFEVGAAAWLHDLLEDTGVQEDDLRRCGFPDTVVNAVALLTHTENQPRSQYLAAIAACRLATVVKLADTDDNTDPVRRRALHDADPQRAARLERKYEGQREFLLAALQGRTAL